jgi:hypothetical protein
MAGKVIKIVGKMAHTKGMILVFLDTLGRPARTSEITAAIMKRYPEACVSAAMNDMQGREIERLTFERDGKFALRVMIG